MIKNTKNYNINNNMDTKLYVKDFASIIDIYFYETFSIPNLL